MDHLAKCWRWCPGWLRCLYALHYFLSVHSLAYRMLLLLMFPPAHASPLMKHITYICNHLDSVTLLFVCLSIPPTLTKPHNIILLFLHETGFLLQHLTAKKTSKCWAAIFNTVTNHQATWVTCYHMCYHILWHLLNAYCGCYFCWNHFVHSSHLVFLVSAQVSYAVLFEQLVVILLGKFFFPGTG